MFAAAGTRLTARLAFDGHVIRLNVLPSRFAVLVVVANRSILNFAASLSTRTLQNQLRRTIEERKPASTKLNHTQDSKQFNPC